MTKNLWLSFWTVALTLTVGCGGDALSTQDASPGPATDMAPGPVPGQDHGPTPATSCADVGGQCVAVYPGTCDNGHSIGADSCGGGIGIFCCVPGKEAPACTPLSPSGGSANPASAYCDELGYGQAPNGKCMLPNGVVCDEWAFYRGQCGQSSSFCEKHGGTLTNQTTAVGDSNQSYGLCTLPTGKTCTEEEFSHSCDCK